MTTPIPDALLKMHPEFPAEVWQRLSAVRYFAPHPSGARVLAVQIFGETMSRGARAGTEQAAFADLIEHAARLAAHRVACYEGTPVVRPNNEANQGVVGCCWWCGKFAEQHGAIDVDPDAADRRREMDRAAGDDGPELAS